MKRLFALVILLALPGLPGLRAGDVRAILDSSDGSSAFVVTDQATNQLLRVSSDGAVIGGGLGHAVSGTLGSVGGGLDNAVTATFGRIGGGAHNRVSAYGGTVAGGGGVNGLSGLDTGNAVHGDFGFVGGGIGNTAGTNAYYAAVAGGYFNAASGIAAAVGGGSLNTANGNYATVPGGIDSHANADYAFAAGRGAIATNTGAFVWADGTAAYFRSLRSNEFRVRAGGGVTFFSDTNATVGVRLAPGGNGWSAVSDRTLKENFAPVDGDALLEKLAAVPVQTWNMRTQPADIRHLGPTAQDFHAAFGLGESPEHISYSDADGVALAAIQALHRRLADTERRLDEALRAIERLQSASPSPETP